MRREWSQEECAYKNIPEHPIKLDFTGCRYIMQFHEILEDMFDVFNDVHQDTPYIEFIRIS